MSTTNNRNIITSISIIISMNIVFMSNSLYIVANNGVLIIISNSTISCNQISIANCR